jgi:hypothetical protein
MKRLLKKASEVTDTTKIYALMDLSGETFETI